MTLTGQNIVGFERSGESDKKFYAKDPNTQSKLDTPFYEATSAEIDVAVQKAENAFGVYQKLGNEQRASFLEAIGEELINLGQTLIDRCMKETALPEARLNGERMRTVNQLNLFASVIREGSWVDARIDTAIPDRQPLPKPDIRQIHIPLGPVGIFGASNFPLAFSVAGGDTASALAAGCPVVVKAHPLHPGTSELVGQAIIKAARNTGMPEGVFSLLQGTSDEVGTALVNHPKICAVGFTGSFKGGKALFDLANKRPTPIPVFAEMGSSNPVFILPGAIKEKIDALASGIVNSVNLGVGQFCTNPGILITNESIDTSQLMKSVAELMATSAPGTMLSEGIKFNYQSGIDRLANHDKTEWLTAGTNGETGNVVKSNLFRVRGADFIENPELAEEVFGPSTISITAQDKKEMLRIADHLEGHLTATIHGSEEDLEEYQALIGILERKVGRIIINGYPTGVEVCHSMVHGGPYPATTAVQSTSVGTGAIKRFARSICYQDFPQSMLPDTLKDGNPQGIWRMYNGEIGKE